MITNRYNPKRECSECDKLLFSGTPKDSLCFKCSFKHLFTAELLSVTEQNPRGVRGYLGSIVGPDEWSLPKKSS